MTEDERRDTIDGEHLRVLGLCYLVSAGISAFFSLFGILYACMGLLITGFANSMPPGREEPPPEFLAAFLGVIGLGMFALLMGFAVLKFYAAKCLKARQSRGFCMFAAAVTCLSIPFGTALGVITLIVLNRDSIARRFDVPVTPAPVPGGIA